MSSNIGWHFPPTGGGTYDGFNDPGVAHFDGAHEKSLARETLQNSLDAQEESGKPVTVEFEIRHLDSSTLGLSDLGETVTACLTESDLSEKAQIALVQAQELLSAPRVTCLRISDRNTTGLHGNQWTALVKARGISVKDEYGAGGSHGIGKFAPFAVSPLRTVFYWTKFAEGDESRELFQGRAILMSHITGSAKRQGTGYWGLIDNCRELSGTAIPEQIRTAEQGSDFSSGTSLWIAGFRDEGGWQDRTARSVVTNFFGAIQDGSLSVIIEPSQKMERDNLLVIEKGTIGRWFEHLEPDLESDGEDAREASDAHLFWKLLRSEPSSERQFPDLGHCRLWIRVEDGLPSRVALMRKTGMLITTRQGGLIRFHGLRNFIAICRFEGDDGNELLRKMENPRHDQFEPDHLPADQRSRGRRALNRITRWIREELQNEAGFPPASEPTNVAELARLLPDLEPEESFGGGKATSDSEPDPQFGGSPVVRLTPRRPPARLTVDIGEENGGNNGGEGKGGESNGGKGTGEGNGKDQVERTGSTRRRRERISIGDVRLVPITGRTGRYRVSFTALSGGIADVELMEAGDSILSRRYDVRAYAPDGSTLSLEGLELKPHNRVQFEITADDPIGDRAWVVAAVRKVP